EPEHHARYLLALLGTDTSTQAARAVERFAGLKPRATASGPDGQQALEIEDAILKEWRSIPHRREDSVPFSGDALERVLASLIGVGGSSEGAAFLRRRVHGVEVDRQDGHAALVFMDRSASPTGWDGRRTTTMDGLRQPPPTLVRHYYLPEGDDALRAFLHGLGDVHRIRVTAQAPGGLLAELGVLARWREGDGRTERKQMS
ncbi:MAG: hypothetical protein HQL51_14555, partial [Magnetococcales bacterium]|nr:hypothetical protein [Magnetococcales bacterium]